MAVRVISGPAPIVTPGEVPGDHAAADAVIAAIIAGVQASIDGPTGWLGRALGEQELEMTLPCFRRQVRLPYRPVQGIDGVSYRDEDGEEQTIDPAHYRLAGGDAVIFAPDFTPSLAASAPDAMTIRYTAGYEAEKVPANAKQAVIIGVQHLKALASQSVFLRADEVDGIGSDTFTVSEAGAAVVKAATESLLSPLRIYSL